jgi:hypothetical protein
MLKLDVSNKGEMEIELFFLFLWITFKSYSDKKSSLIIRSLYYPLANWLGYKDILRLE